MNQSLTLSFGCVSNAGVKALNQDFIGQYIPKDPILALKGACFVIADGISSSQVSQVASKASVQAFLEDYYCTPEAWTTESSVDKVVKSINSWLFAQSQNSPYKYDKDKGYVSTFAGLILTCEGAHIFNLGDTRVYRLRDGQLEQITVDHRKIVSSQQSYLSRALGVNQFVDVDHFVLDIAEGDIFINATDGIYEFVELVKLIETIDEQKRLQNAAEQIVEQALENKSDDNLSIQIIRVDKIDKQLNQYKLTELSEFSLPPKLAPRVQFDGFEVIRQIYISSRSHVYLAKELATGLDVALKVPSTELAKDPLYLERFMLEDWIAKRVNHVNVIRGIKNDGHKRYLYIATEYIQGQNLDQWMRDNPKPSLNQVRHIVRQIADGLQAFHRQEMIHQDIRPQNIMIDNNNTVKIIDFGSTYIAGVTELQSDEITRGTLRYSAPEYFLGQAGTQRSDIYALAVIVYQMLTGDFPYPNQISQAHSRKAQQKYKYKSIITEESEWPSWIDEALKKALQLEPWKRYSELSEFVFDLHRPNKHFLAKTKPPLIERDPVMFWQCISLILFILLIKSWL